MSDQIIRRLRQRHEDYEGPRGCSWWKLLRDAHDGAGGFRAAIERAQETWWGEGDLEAPTGGRVPCSYVTRYPREGAPAYIRRVRVATYTNFTAPVIREYAGHLWRTAPQREGSAPLMAFWASADGHGTQADDWMREGTRRAQLYGWAVALVDRPAGDLSQADAQTYARWLQPEELVDWELDGEGGFAWARLCTEVCERDPWGEEVEREVYTTWTPKTWRRHVLEEREGRHVLVEDTAEVPHDLGRVPLSVLYWSEPESDDLYGLSQVDAIVGLSLEHFNVKSELREWERGQNFAILCVQSHDTNVLQGIKVGVHGGIRVEPEMDMPMFIAPPSSIGAHLITRLDGIAASIYAAANLERATATQTGPEVSGVSRAYEFAARTQTQLVDFARRCEAFERDLAALVLGWSRTADASVRIAYPQSFDVTDLATRLAHEFDVLSRSDALVPEILRGARERLARALDPDATPQRVRETERAIDELYQAERRAFEARTTTPPAGTAPAGSKVQSAGDTGNAGVGST